MLVINKNEFISSISKLNLQVFTSNIYYLLILNSNILTTLTLLILSIYSYHRNIKSKTILHLILFLIYSYITFKISNIGFGYNMFLNLFSENTKLRLLDTINMINLFTIIIPIILINLNFGTEIDKNRINFEFHEQKFNYFKQIFSYIFIIVLSIIINLIYIFK